MDRFNPVQGRARPIMGGPQKRLPVARWVRSGYNPTSRLGQPTSPDAEAAARLEVSSTVRDLAVELRLRIGRLEQELSMAWSDQLRAGIPFIGPAFSQGEAIGQVALVSRALEEISESILGGPLSGYASGETGTTLSDSVNTLRGISSSAEGYAQPLASGHEGLAEEHLHSYVEDLRDLRDAAERLMVSAEGAPPIYEPGEKERTGARGVLWAVGALSVSGLLLYLVSGD